MEPTQIDEAQPPAKAQIITKTTPMSYMSLQLLIEFERVFQAFWATVTFVFLYYKRYQLIYPDGYFEIEQVAMLLLLALQYFRLYCGSKGNKTETSSTTFVFIVLIIPCFVGNVYYAVLQTYALAWELIMGVVLLICQALELVLALFAAIDFKSLEKAG